MTLEEAIKHCEEVAEAEEQKYKEWKGDYSHLKKIDSCIECAKDHRQLVEWLRKLKAYESDDEICKYCTHTHDADYCNMCKHNTIFVDYFNLEVNDDGDNS